jgi:hypothetical protein
MKPYALKRYAKTYDELGTPIYSYVAVATIPVSINDNITTAIENGILYTIKTPTGITGYKLFDLKENYRLEGNGSIYEITGINQGGRLTQLTLKEVLI